MKVLCHRTIASLTVFAATSLSGATQIAPTTADAGGGTMNGVSSQHQVSVGSIGVVSTASVVTSKSGFIGQLYEAESLSLTPPSPSVTETGSSKLSALLVMDDASLLPVANLDVSWILKSPYAAVSAAGLVNTGVVYQNESVRVNGTYGSLNGSLLLTILDDLKDNYLGYATDGLGDDWQVGFFGEANAAAGPASDPDGDGQNNLFEFIAGLNPTDARSRFEVEIEPIFGAPGAASILYGPVRLRRSYQVWAVDSLTSSTWFKIEAPTTAQTVEKEKVTDPAAISGKRFYRVEITAQEPM